MDDKAYYTILGAAIAAITAAVLKILDFIRWHYEVKKRREDELASKLYEIYMNCIYYCDGAPYVNPTTLAFGGSPDAPDEIKIDYWTKLNEFKSQRRKWLSLLVAFHPCPNSADSRDFKEKLLTDKVTVEDLITLLSSDRRLTHVESSYEYDSFVQSRN